MQCSWVEPELTCRLPRVAMAQVFITPIFEGTGQKMCPKKWPKKYSGARTSPSSAAGGWPARQLWTIASRLAWVGLSCQSFKIACFAVNLICLPKIKLTLFILLRSEATQATIGAQSESREDRWSSYWSSYWSIYWSSYHLVCLKKTKYGGNNDGWHRSLAGTYPFNLNTGQQQVTRIKVFLHGWLSWTWEEGQHIIQKTIWNTFAFWKGKNLCKLIKLHTGSPAQLNITPSLLFNLGLCF